MVATLDKLSCLSLYIFLSFWGNERRQKPNIPYLSVETNDGFGKSAFSNVEVLHTIPDKIMGKYNMYYDYNYLIFEHKNLFNLI